MDKISVTIAVPTYMGEKFLEKNIESILSQTYRPDQIIYVEGGSSDGSLQILKRYSSIEIIIQDGKRGLCEARNLATAAAKGDIIIFVDVDTVCEPHFIETIVRQYSSLLVVAVGGRNIESRILTVYDLCRKKRLSQYAPLLSLENAPFIAGACCSFRTKVLKDLGGFDTLLKAGEDCDIGMRINKNGLRIVYTPDAIVYHQRTDDKDSLLKLAYSYTFWKVIVCAKNRNKQLINYPMVFKGMFCSMLSDILKEKNLKLCVLDLLVSFACAKGIKDARKNFSSFGLRRQ